MDLFNYLGEKNIKKNTPLAERLRPNSISDVIGQRHLLSSGKFLKRVIKSGNIPSIIFYGPTGTGKTTLARLIASENNMKFLSLNAVTSGVKDIREAINKSRDFIAMDGKQTILFIDEIHRFSKNQQDALLPYVEDGTIIFIGATTENPYFEVNNALISRVSILKLYPLNEEDIKQLIFRALNEDTKISRYNIKIDDDALNLLIRASNGDGRRALNIIEIAALSISSDQNMIIKAKDIVESMEEKYINYDKDGDNHYDIISALIKSIRGSDENAALHYLAKMLLSGEKPEFICRRLIILASEDIGLADNFALIMAQNTYNAVSVVGMPEAKIIMSHLVIYLSKAKKDNRAYKAILKAFEDAENISTSVPNHLKDSHYKGAELLGHGKGYKYSHDYDENSINQEYMPEELKGKIYY